MVDAALLTAGRDARVAGDIDRPEVTMRQVVKIVMDEINTLRALHGLPARTLAQLRNAIRNGYGS